MTAGRDTGAPPQVIDVANDGQGGTINGLGSITASATARNLNTPDSGLTTWNSTSAGRVSFNDLGWANGAASSSASSLAGTFWEYTFKADID